MIIGPCLDILGSCYVIACPGVRDQWTTDGPSLIGVHM